MRIKRLVLIAVLCSLSVLFIGLVGLNAVDATESSFIIQLKSRQFEPPQLNVVDNMSATLPAGARHGLVQFYEPPSAETRAALAEAGLHLFNYVPTNTWLAALPADLSVLSKWSEIRWIGPLSPMDKIDSAEYEAIIRAEGAVNLWVTTFEDVDESGSQAIFGRMHAVSSAPAPMDHTWRVTVAPDALGALLAEDGVMWVQADPGDPQPLTDGIRDLTNADLVHGVPFELDGSGTQIALFDQGIVDTAHPDFAGRVIYTDDAPIDNHTTHVAGILASSGVNSAAHGGEENQWCGIAPGTELISYRVASPIFPHEDAINIYGADVSQNSWGIVSCSLMGKYTGYAPSYDDLVTGLYGDPISVVFSAGNSRGACGGDYVSVLGSAQSAKNVLTVGAVNDDGSYNGSASSWGPTVDGRIKPELVAPGVSIRSTLPGGGYGGYTGSSQAAPAVSGAIALLQQHTARVCDAGSEGQDAKLLPATARAILLHSATDLGNPGPDYSFGFGLLDLNRAVRSVPAHVEAVIESGTMATYSAEVTPGQEELRVTLAWDDPPAVANAAVALINDLDLELIAPDGTSYGPWILDPTPGNEANLAVRPVWSSGDAPVRDTLNVVEQVVVDNPQPGTWQVRVVAVHLPEGPQPFALVGADLTNGSCGYVDQPAIITVLNPEQNSVAQGQVPVVVEAVDMEDDATGLDVELAVNGGAWEPMGQPDGTSHFETMLDTAQMAPGVADLTVRVTDSAENQVVSSLSVYIEGAPTGVSMRPAAVETSPVLSPLLLVTFSSLMFMTLAVGFKPALARARH